MKIEKIQEYSDIYPLEAFTAAIMQVAAERDSKGNVDE